MAKKQRRGSKQRKAGRHSGRNVFRNVSNRTLVALLVLSIVVSLATSLVMLGNNRSYVTGAVVAKQSQSNDDIMNQSIERDRQSDRGDDSDFSLPPARE